jgi:hypothetical protein
MQVNNLESTTEPVVNQEIIEKKEIENPSKAEESSKDEDSVQDPNWRAFREARKRDRAEKEAAERRAAEKEAEIVALKLAMEAAFAKEHDKVSQRQSSRDEIRYDDDESEDERIEKKVQAALSAREAAYEKQRQEREQQEYPQKLVQTYPDFHSMITPENLDYLEYHYPEVAAPLKRQYDGYDKWSDTYRAIKKFVPNASSAKKDAARAEQNFSKPKSISAPGMTQTTEGMGSNILSEDRKAANWQRMQKLLKGV